MRPAARCGDAFAPRAAKQSETANCEFRLDAPCSRKAQRGVCKSVVSTQIVSVARLCKYSQKDVLFFFLVRSHDPTESCLHGLVSRCRARARWRPTMRTSACKRCATSSRSSVASCDTIRKSACLFPVHVAESTARTHTSRTRALPIRPRRL